MKSLLVMFCAVTLAGCSGTMSINRAPEINAVVVEQTLGDFIPETKVWRLEGRKLFAGRMTWSKKKGQYFEPDYEATLDVAECRAILDAAATIPVSSPPPLVRVDFPPDLIRLSGEYDYTVRLEYLDSNASISAEEPITEFMPLVKAMNRCLLDGHKIDWQPKYPYTIANKEPNATAPASPSRTGSP